MKKPLTLPAFPELRRGARVLLAYSGGLDSTVLLHVLATAHTPRLTALHIHHGLQDAADGWAKTCRKQCRALGVPFKLLHVKIDPRDPTGPEAAARAARYAALAGQMKAGDLLVTAHHQDDQAETVLLRLLRGTGIAGLAAMRALKPFAPGQLWRPLLETPRAMIREYARQQQLQWIEDPHNLNPRYARSFLRAEIVPRLRQQWPQATAALTRAAWHAGEAEGLLQELASAALQAVGRVSDSVTRPTSLSCAGLMELSASRRNNLIRYWLAQSGFAAPAAGVLERLEREVLLARADAQPLLHGEAYEFRRYRDDLYVMAPLSAAPLGELAWNGKDRLALPAGCGELVSNARIARALTVRFTQEGAKFKPQGEAHTRTLKYLFQQAGLPPWQRLRLPLIYRGDELLSVADRWLGAEWAAELKRKKTCIRWLRHV